MVTIVKRQQYKSNNFRGQQKKAKPYHFYGSSGYLVKQSQILRYFPGQETKNELPHPKNLKKKQKECVLPYFQLSNTNHHYHYPQNWQSSRFRLDQFYYMVWLHGGHNYQNSKWTKLDAM
jgi:hypothetical protein